MKVLVTGANGLLGQHLVELLLYEAYSVLAISRGEKRLPYLYGLGYGNVDLSDADSINTAFAIDPPDVVVHAGAMTQVDECETNQQACSVTNIDGTINIIRAAEKFSKHLIYISTDFVFDGKRGNYVEDDLPNPVNFYGKTKLRAEELVRQSSLDWAVVRTCLVYGNSFAGTRSNIITWVKESLEQKKKIKVVNDQVRTPTYVEDLAKGILLVINKKAKGIYHISGNEVLTPYQMAIKTADFFGLDKDLIEEVNASTFSQPAKRPLKTGFDISKAVGELNFKPGSFNDSLLKMFSKEL